MSGIRLRVGKTETRGDYRGVSGKRGAANGSRERLKARRPGGDRNRAGNREAESQNWGFLLEIDKKPPVNRPSVEEM